MKELSKDFSYFSVHWSVEKNDKSIRETPLSAGLQKEDVTPARPFDRCEASVPKKLHILQHFRQHLIDHLRICLTLCFFHHLSDEEAHSFLLSGLIISH